MINEELRHREELENLHVVVVEGFTIMLKGISRQDLR